MSNGRGLKNSAQALAIRAGVSLRPSCDRSTPNEARNTAAVGAENVIRAHQAAPRAHGSAAPNAGPPKDDVGGPGADRGASRAHPEATARKPATDHHAGDRPALAA